MKSGTHFHFKKFSLRHDQCSMKVGTDAVLLGAWADVANVSTILDIGTGCGVIALMLAQRTDDTTRIDAIEISKQDTDQAMENILISPWRDKVKVQNIAVQKYSGSQMYDMIISNPPYFNNSQKPMDERRIETRHTTSLQYDALLLAVLRLLKPDGKFNIILPYTEGEQFIALAKAAGLFSTRKFSFRSRAEKPVERWLLEFSPFEKPVRTGEVLLYGSGSIWSESYVALTRDFYLKL